MEENIINKLYHFEKTHLIKIANQWQFKKNTADKLISEKSLEKTIENIKTSSKKKARKIIYG